MAELRLKRRQVVCREGDVGTCMYYVRWGRVGIFKDFGTKAQKHVAECGVGEYFGEAGLIEGARRSATVVALEAETIVREITEDDFRGYLADDPAQALAILQSMCHKLRTVNRDYLEACREVSRVVGTGYVDATSDYGLGQSELLRQIADGCAETDGLGEGGAS